MGFNSGFKGLTHSALVYWRYSALLIGRIWILKYHSEQFRSSVR